MPETDLSQRIHEEMRGIIAVIERVTKTAFAME